MARGTASIWSDITTLRSQIRAGLDCSNRFQRLRELRKLPRRRKALERGREDVMRLDRTGGRLIELRERERRAQFEAARPLLSRDGDGELERFLGRGEVRVIALEQRFAADAMQFRFERPVARAF